MPDPALKFQGVLARFDEVRESLPECGQSCNCQHPRKSRKLETSRRWHGLVLTRRCRRLRSPDHVGTVLKKQNSLNQFGKR